MPFEDMSYEELEHLYDDLHPKSMFREQVREALQKADPETRAEQRYFDMCDPAYVHDLTTPWEETLEGDAYYDDFDQGYADYEAQMEEDREFSEYLDEYYQYGVDDMADGKLPLWETNEYEWDSLPHYIQDEYRKGYNA